MKRISIIFLLIAVLCFSSGSCGPGGGGKPVIIPSIRLTLENPAPMILSGSIQFNFKLACSLERPSAAIVYYSTDGGYSFIPATLDNASEGTLEGNIIHSITAPYTAKDYYFIWNSVTDLGHDYVQDVQILVEVVDVTHTEPTVYWPYHWTTGYAGNGKVSKVFIIDNDRAPVVTVTTPSSPQSGDVLMEFTLTDLDTDLCRVTVEYSKDNGTNYFAATLKEVGSYTVSGNIIFGLDGTPTPKRHAFIWDSAADMPLQYNEQVKVKLVANDGIKDSNASETDAFTLTNNSAPLVTIDDPGGTQTGDVTLDFTLVDIDSSEATLTFNYSTDSGATWSPATIKFTSVGTLSGGLVIVPTPGAAPVSGYCVWDSLGDGVATENLETNVRISVYAEDDQRQGPTVMTRSFIVDNTLAGGWGPIETLSTGADASAPACALLPSPENPVVIWSAPDCSSIAQVYMTDHDGVSWSAPAAVTSSATGATYPRLAITPDYFIHIAYVETGAVYYTFNNTVAWSAPVKLSGSGAAGEPDIAGDAGDDAHVVWKEFAAGRYEIKYCLVSGGTPGSVETASNSSENSESPSIAMDGVTPYVAWSDSSMGRWEILCASGPVTWTPLGIVSDTPGNSRKPGMAIDAGGDIAVAWMDDTPVTNFDAYVNVYSGSWGNAVNVSGNEGNSVTPCVSYRGGIPRTVWSDNGNAAQNYEVAFSSLLSGSGTPAVNLSNTTGESNAPVLVTGSTGKQILAWQEITAGGNVILARMR